MPFSRLLSVGQVYSCGLPIDSKIRYSILSELLYHPNHFQVADIATTYPWIVSMYLLITGVLSFFGVFWFEDNLKKPKYQECFLTSIHCIVYNSILGIQSC